jgi:predicted CoA-binding protein
MMQEALRTLKAAQTFALLGASAEPGKYGHKVFSTLKDRFRVLPVNPKRPEIEGTQCYASYAALPEKPDAVILALAPAVTEALVPKLIAEGAPLLWLPPECFTEAAVDACKKAGTPVIYDVCPVAALLALDRLRPSTGP